MKLRHHELRIDEHDPFLNCKLDRRKYGKILTDIVSNYSDGFVLAIDNQWGTGKTTFVKMWLQHLKNESFETVYFNAWENDFDTDPLAAIMGELDSLVNRKNKRAYKSALQKGAVLARNIIPGIVKAATAGVVDAPTIVDLIENSAKGTVEVLQAQIDEYKKKKESITTFRLSLEEFIEMTDSSKPVIFVVDELDRCRPNYAVEVLEQLKHLFSVHGIVFVLSIDKTHLGACINGYYGSDKINTSEYLRRFIDVEYTIPPPSIPSYCKYLYSYYGYDEFFEATGRANHISLKHEIENLKIAPELAFRPANTTLRQLEKVYAKARLALLLFHDAECCYPELMILLAYYQVVHPEIYSKLRNKGYSLDELGGLLYELIPYNSQNQHQALYYIALFLVLYANEYDIERTSYFRRGPSGDNITDLKGFGPVTDVEMATYLSRAIYEDRSRGTKLGSLMTKLELIEPITLPH